MKALWVRDGAFAGSEAADSFASMANYYASSDLAGGRPDNISVHGLAIRLFEANRYTIPFVNSHRLTVAIEVVTVLLLSAPFLMRWNDGERKPTSAELLVQIALAMSIPLVWGPMTNGSHLMLAARDKRWTGAAIVWCALFLARMTPIRLESRWFGNAFGSPPEASWETAAGFWALWTAQGTALLIAAAVLTGWASVVTTRDRARAKLTASEPDVRAVGPLPGE